VVVLTGEGRAFCSGQDLGDRANVPTTSTSSARCATNTSRCSCAIVDCPVPDHRRGQRHGGRGGGEPRAGLRCGDRHGLRQLHPGLQPHRPDPGCRRHYGRCRGRSASPRPWARPSSPSRISAAQAADWGMIWEAVPDDPFRGGLAQPRGASGPGPDRGLQAHQAGAAGQLRKFASGTAAARGAIAGPMRAHPATSRRASWPFSKSARRCSKGAESFVLWGLCPRPAASPRDISDQRKGKTPHLPLVSSIPPPKPAPSPFRDQAARAEAQHQQQDQPHGEEPHIGCGVEQMFAQPRALRPCRP
jgi:hypothetical protein